MKYNGIKIKKIKWLAAINIGKQKDSPVKSVFNTGYSPIGIGYPMTLQECHNSINKLITNVIKCCGISKQKAETN